MTSVNTTYKGNTAPIRKVTFMADGPRTQPTVGIAKKKRASWNLLWRVLLLLVDLLPTIPHYYHYKYTDDYNMLLGVAGHSATLFLSSLLLIANPWKPKNCWNELVEIIAGEWARGKECRCN